jgi:organic hydroperoxide reductase OsmC/OhrA
MHPYPHKYQAGATGGSTGAVVVSSPGLPELSTAPPAQFDGPGDRWSPETLLIAAVADCYVLTFRALSRAARLEWRTLECTVEGALERVDGVAQFSQYDSKVVLVVSSGIDHDKARQLLEKAEHACLISNSLRGSRTLHVTIREE